MWQKLLAPSIKAGKLVAIGVVQEQHPDRARLYRQWRQLDWPIYVDSLNLMGHRVVPIPVGIDENGIVQSSRPRTNSFVKNFVDAEFKKITVPKSYNRLEKKALPKAVNEFLWGDAAKSVDLFRRTAKDDKGHFRLGVALRRRYESKDRKAGDGQEAVAEWGVALAMNPNQYIWRRRIQQYGPRLDKPYNFYFWVEEARKDIRARGEKPVELVSEPRGSEVAAPKRRAAPEEVSIPNPDPDGKLFRDKNRHVKINAIVTPARVRPGHRVRVRVTFRVDKDAWWNNEADKLNLSAKVPGSLVVEEGKFTHPIPAEAESREIRVLEFEAKVDSSANGKVTIPAYATYGVCEDKGGTCMFLRQDFEVTVIVDPKAPKIQ